MDAKEGTHVVKPDPVVRSPRDLYNVIVRLPAAMRQELADIAIEEKISQNQLINSYLFTALFAARFEPKCGSPEDVERLFRAIEVALGREDGLAFGAFHKEDWDGLEPCVQKFAEAGLITPPQARTEPEMETTVAFTFTITKTGRMQLPVLLRMLRPRAAGLSKERQEGRQPAPV